LKDNETHIIEGIKSGSESSFEKLFEQYYRLLSIFAFKYLNDLETSKEIVQDLFVHLYENRRKITITTSLRSYLYQSVRNRCLNHLRLEQIKKAHLEQIARTSDPTEDLEASIRETELEHRIFLIIRELPERCRDIFTMSRVQGIKNNEIASQLNISIRTVETQISNALKALRKNLGDDFLS